MPKTAQLYHRQKKIHKFSLWSNTWNISWTHVGSWGECAVPFSPEPFDFILFVVEFCCLSAETKVLHDYLKYDTFIKKNIKCNKIVHTILPVQAK